MSIRKSLLPVSSFRLCVSLFVCCAAFLLLLSAGCGSGKKKAPPKKDYGKPTWQKVDSSKFAALSDYETTLEGGKVLVFDPEGWERMPRGAAKPPKGFKSIIVFQKGEATVMMTKSEKARDMPDLDESNIEEFAESVQQLFKTPVKMVKLGNVVGVLFGRRSQHAQRLNKQMERRIIATSIGGELFTYELVTDRGKMNDDLLNVLYAVASKTQIEGMDASEDGTGDATDQVATTTADSATKPAETIETASTTSSPTPSEEKTPEIKAEETKPAETAAIEPVETKTEAKSAEPKAEEVAVSKPEPKKEEKKPAKKPAKKKGNTKDILNELDALLN